jgi:8-oxo-dGTP pyrophosphatase MutT (NUDIX family)
MPIPDFVLELRRHVGRQQLWLPGVTAVIRHDDSVLLVKRTDNGEWAPVSGIVDPGEEPGVAARREALEETGVTISVDRLAAVKVSQPVVYPNGDRAVYLDHSFACSWVDGEPHVADDESTEVRWFRFDALPPMKRELVERIEAALADEPRTRFLH